MEIYFRTLLFLLASSAFAQPLIFYRGVVNSASYLPPGLPNGSVARGSMFTIFGRSIGPASSAQVSVFPLQPALAGVSVDISQGASAVSALPVFVSAGQINAILPSNTPLGWVSVRVHFNNTTTNYSRLFVSENSVGLFAANGAGFGPGIVQNFISASDQPINSQVRTAKPGQYVILWGTGLGAVSFPDNNAPEVVVLPIAVEIFVGGKKVTDVLYSGRTPCCASIDQYVFAVPNDAPSGCYVPVSVRTRGTTVSNTVTMAIDPAGAPCADAHNPLTMRDAGKLALAHLARQTIHADLRVTPQTITIDTAAATFREHAGGEFSFSALTALPPRGSCAVYSGTASKLFSPTQSILAPVGGQVAVGSPLRVTTPAGSANLLPGTTGLEASFAMNLTQSLLNSGPYGISAPGSGPIAAFQAMLDHINPLTWTNRNSFEGIDRTRELTVTWTDSPAAGRGVAIAGSSTRVSYDAGAAFLCLALPGASSFTIPSYVLSALPASDNREFESSAEISIGNVPLSGGVAIPGFAQSAVGASSWVTKTVFIRGGAQ